MKNQLKDLRHFLDAHTSFCVLSHIRPDGDAYGSSLGFALVLQAMGKKVAVYNEDGASRPYQFLPGQELLSVTPTTAPSPETAIIAVDTSNQERLGKTFVSWNRQPDLNLDHHLSNPGYAKINVIDSESPATAQVLYELIESLELPCPPAAAINLYVGLMTDTGSFRFRQTTARTFDVAAELVRLGADPSAASQHCYQSSSVERFNLVREVLAATQFAFENRVAYYHLSPELYAKTGAQPDDTENLLEHLQAVSTVQVAFVLEPLTEGGVSKIRGSLRSRGQVDVNALAGKFGGGGHRLAAGFRSSRPLAEIETTLLAEIKKVL